MKQEGKIKRIFQAFTEESDLPDEIVKERLDICSKCPFNTLNIDNKELTLIQRQKKIINDFCTKCGCFIDKKTSRAGESCGLESVGEKPKWNRVVLKTVDSSDLNLQNLTYNICDMKISEMKDSYELDLYSFNSFDTAIELEILDKDVSEVTLKPYCSCTVVNVINENIFSIFLNVEQLTPNSNINKTIEIKYKKNNKEFNSKIIIKGKYEL